MDYAAQDSCAFKKTKEIKPNKQLRNQVGVRSRHCGCRLDIESTCFLNVHKGVFMSPLTLVIFIIAIILLITGGLIETLRFLLWVAVVLFVISVIMFLLRSIGGRK